MLLQRIFVTMHHLNAALLLPASLLAANCTDHALTVIRYDTIRWWVFNVHKKLTGSQLSQTYTKQTKLEINMHHLPKAMQYRQATCSSDCH